MKMNEQIEMTAERYLKRYKPQMEAFQKHSPLRFIRSVNEEDICALGEQFEQWNEYHRFLCNEMGSAKELGTLPNLALDIITLGYGNSIIPIIASTQPIEEVQGVVYYKEVRAISTKGNVTAEDRLRGGTTAPDVYAVGYAGEVKTETGAIASPNTAVTITIQAGAVPVRPNTVKVLATAPATWQARDDGEGNMLGLGCWGTVVYASGVITLKFTVAPTASTPYTVQYGVNYEEGATIPKIKTQNANIPVEAEIFTLGTEIGMFKAFAMKKRFGRVAEDDMVQDLTNEITAELGQTALYRLRSAMPVASVVTWNKTPRQGVSWFEHKQELKDKISHAEAKILTAAGRGVVNVLIAGTNAASYLSNLPGFEKVQTTAQGPQVYGKLDGLTVLRDPSPGVSEKILCVYKGSGKFDTPCVYAPYMPLFVSGTIPMQNPVMRQGVAAVWAGIKAVVGAFVAEIQIVSTPTGSPVGTNN